MELFKTFLQIKSIMALECYFGKKEDVGIFEAMLEKKNKESYIEVFEIIKESTKDIAGNPAEIAIYLEKDYFRFFSRQRRFNEMGGIKTASLLYLVSKDHVEKNATNRKRAVDFIRHCALKSGLEFEERDLRIWVIQYFNLGKSYINSPGARKETIILSKPITYKTAPNPKKLLE